MNSKRKFLIDPPSGWLYGFPKDFNPDKDNYEKILRKSGYPAKDIQFALANSRVIEVPDNER